MQKEKSKKKVMIGMSGGVDSSVSAYLLSKEGYNVIGVTMQIWPDQSHDDGCCSLSSVEDARRVANKFGIPYYVFNMKEDFQKYVIEYFVKEYEGGRTPNPCIACNRYIKFGSLLDKAKSMNIDYVATGHYAIIDKVGDRYLLKKSADENKDQTYVLYNLTQDQLSKTLFPLGKYRKTEIREIAKELGLSVATKPDSQEICFIDDNDHHRFIKEHTGKEPKKGFFVDTKGNTLGFHSGITKYTIGQRRGLGIAMGKPMFVVDIDVENNTVILGDNDDLFTKEFIAYDLNWISIETLDKPMRVKAKIRYKALEQDATISPLDNGKVNIVFDEKQRAVTSGQSVVFYDGDTVVGGGIIE
jgi:tRNA-specific 2-thiouridylase